MYYNQFKAPCFHSCHSPKVKIIRKIILDIDQIVRLDNFIVKIIGNNKAISISKIKKIMAIRKKLIENGIRLMVDGSNPHSKGVIFSKFSFIFFEIKIEIFITKFEIMIINSLEIIIK